MAEAIFTKESVKSLYAFAYRFYQNGKYDQAAHFFRLLTVLEPGEKKNWMGLGASLQMDKKFESALEVYGYAALQDENDPYVHFHAAECFFALKKRDKGQEALNSVTIVAGKKKKYAELMKHVDLISQAWSDQELKVED